MVRLLLIGVYYLLHPRIRLGQRPEGIINCLPEVSAAVDGLTQVVF